MIGTIDIEVNAANPNVPLKPLYTFIGSPSSVRVRNVPRQIGAWKITRVYVEAIYPDNEIASIQAELVGGVWVATLPAAAAVGSVSNGITIKADGLDEHSVPVEDYVLGKGDYFILDADSTIHSGATTYYLHLIDDVPEHPKKGDMTVIDGVVKFYDGSAWVAFGGGSGALEAPFEVVKDGQRYSVDIYDDPDGIGFDINRIDGENN